MAFPCPPSNWNIGNHKLCGLFCPERDPKHQATGTEALITLLFQGGYVTPNDSSLPNELHYITRKHLRMLSV
uniref:Uncharacterized protein n=1 Tax=Anguilla anguilla TaxID=7936 RepID=A0A0E9T105_ANGAN